MSRGTRDEDAVAGADIAHPARSLRLPSRVGVGCAVFFHASRVARCASRCRVPRRAGSGQFDCVRVHTTAGATAVHGQRGGTAVVWCGCCYRRGEGVCQKCIYHNMIRAPTALLGWSPGAVAPRGPPPMPDPEWVSECRDGRANPWRMGPGARGMRMGEMPRIQD